METCTFTDCGMPIKAKGLCKAHHTQRLRGQPLRPRRVYGTVEERIQSRIVKSDGCWQWSGAHADTGYGQIRIDNKLVYVHRLMYEREIAPIPPGMEIDHICHNRGCINPAHLEPVTHKQNGENRKGPASNNTSGYRGVTLEAKTGKWIAQAGEGRRNYCFGRFDSREDAAEAASQGRARLFTNSRLDDPAAWGDDD